MRTPFMYQVLLLRGLAFTSSSYTPGRASATSVHALELPPRIIRARVPSGGGTVAQPQADFDAASAIFVPFTTTPVVQRVWS